ncbi:DUF6126 family protein [Streptomyces sp. NPDC085596]
MSDMEEKLPPALWIRVVIYVVLGHLLAAFLFLLFSLGAKG